MSAANDPDSPSDESVIGAKKRGSSRSRSSASRRASDYGAKAIEPNSPSTSDSDEKIPTWLKDTEQPFVPIRDAILISGAPGFADGEIEQAANLEPSMEPSTSTSTPTSKPSTGHRDGSKRRWRKPSNAKELAAQINEVATMVLNEQIDLEVVKPYSTLIRGEVQVLSVQVTQARFAKTVPELDLDLEVFSDDDT